jgi:hypothetical protein
VTSVILNVIVLAVLSFFLFEKFVNPPPQPIISVTPPRTFEPRPPRSTGSSGPFLNPIQRAALADRFEGFLQVLEDSKDPTLPDNVFLQYARGDGKPPFVLYKRDVEFLAKALLGGTERLVSDRFELAEVPYDGSEVTLLLDKNLGRTWRFSGTAFDEVPVQDNQNPLSTNTQFGDFIDLLIEKNSGWSFP